jgi:hypothetical protein
MSERKSFLLRIDPQVVAALRRWADDDLRSLNGQIEYLLRRALQDAGRLKRERSGPPGEGGESPERKDRMPA